MGKNYLVFVAVATLLLTLTLCACSEDDGGEGSDTDRCGDACSNMMNLCDYIDDIDECVEECQKEIEDLNDQEKDNAFDCVNDADSCEELMACSAEGDGEGNSDDDR